MSRLSFKWTLGAVPVAALAPVCIAFGVHLLPARAAAVGTGNVVPWVIGWALVWMTAALAVVLAAAIATIRTDGTGVGGAKGAKP